VNKTKCNLPVGAAAEESMTVKQYVREALQTFSQRTARVAIVVQMYFDVAKTFPTNMRHGVQKFWPIPFGGEEKAVLRRAAVRVGKSSGKPRISLCPRRYSRSLGVQVRSAVRRFEVIGDTKENIDRSVCSNAFAVLG
jgi:hypothetical protein